MKFRTKPQLLAVAFAVIASAAAFFIWRVWLHTGLEAYAGDLSYQAGSHDLLPVAGLVGLVALSLIGIGIAIGVDVGRGRAGLVSSPAAAATAAPITIRVEAAGLQLDSEAAAIVKLIRSYLEASQSYSDHLAQAGRTLPILTEAEEIRTVVKLLVAENEKMQRDSADLKESLEQSKSQIDKLRSSLVEAQELGLRDPLTTIGNRRCFDASLADGIRTARRDRQSMCLVLGDIDHFKRINDAFGHLVGDEVLKLFARLLESNLTSGATVARYGGEEFAIILPATELDEAKRLIEQIRIELEDKKMVVNNGGRQLGRITASFGIAQLAEGDDPAKLIQRADDKLFQAKNAGRNRVAIDSPLAA